MLRFFLSMHNRSETLWIEVVTILTQLFNFIFFFSTFMIGLCLSLKVQQLIEAVCVYHQMLSRNLGRMLQTEEFLGNNPHYEHFIHYFGALS